jgi:hypothetical protein
MFRSGMPPMTPTRTVVVIRARKAWIYVFRTMMIRRIIPIARASSILCPLNPLTILYYLSYVDNFQVPL